MRIHWTKRRTWTQKIRSDVAWLLKAAKIPPQEHVTVVLHYRPGDNRRRDPSNLMPTQKAAVDAMTTAGIVKDDAPQWVTELMPVIHRGAGERALWLEIRAGRRGEATEEQP
jgi:crossover junction endodeoxyribonuclease RusA